MNKTQKLNKRKYMAMCYLAKINPDLYYLKITGNEVKLYIHTWDSFDNVPCLDLIETVTWSKP